MLKATKKDYRRNVKSNMSVHLSIALNKTIQIQKLNSIPKNETTMYKLMSPITMKLYSFCGLFSNGILIVILTQLK